MRLGRYLSSLTKPEIDLLYENCGFIQEEKEIFEMVRNKMTYVQISLRLGYSVKTISRRVSGIKEKIEKARESR